MVCENIEYVIKAIQPFYIGKNQIDRSLAKDKFKFDILINRIYNMIDSGKLDESYFIKTLEKGLDNDDR